MKPSSAKYLPFFVPERDEGDGLPPRPPLHIYTTSANVHVYRYPDAGGGYWIRAISNERVSHSLLGEIAFTGHAGHSCLSGAFKMTMIRDTSWGASASSSASFAPEVSLHPISICSLRSSFRSFPPCTPRCAHRQLLVLLNHYKPSSTLNRKQALVHGRASTRKHLNSTIKSELLPFELSKWPGFPRFLWI